MKISQRIIDYAIWYYLRYYPSKNKLYKKLEEKFWWNSENAKKYWGIKDKEINFILGEKLRNIIQEKEVCFAKIKSLQEKWKNINYMKNNLRQKLFEKDMIENILINDFNIEEKSILNFDKIFKQIENLKNKGKSKQYIRQKFVENNFDKEKIEEFIEEIFDENSEKNSIKILLKKYGYTSPQPSPTGEGVSTKMDYKEKQKILEKIVRKGYSFNDVLEVMEEKTS